MNTCSTCGKENQSHYKFCLGCGAELQQPSQTSAPPSKEKICGKCSARVPAEFRFCGSCGAVLSEQQTSTQKEPAPLAPTPYIPPVKAQKPRADKRDIQKPERVTVAKKDDALRIEYNPPTRTSGYALLIIAVLPLLRILGFIPQAGRLQTHEWPSIVLELAITGVVFLTLLAIGLPRAIETVILEVSGAPQATTSDPFRAEVQGQSYRKITRTHRMLRTRSFDYPCDGIQQLYCAKHTATNANMYSVIAVYRDQRAEEILSDLNELDTARYIEGQLEAALLIEDQPVLKEA
jgi:hypothetical protein